MTDNDPLPDSDDVMRASKTLENIAHRTPVFTSSTLDRRCQTEVFLKCENLQRVGAFKFRGAYNAVTMLSQSERDKGVITYSSGNHGQAIALTGKLTGVKTVVVVPTDAPVAKRAAATAYGAEIILHERDQMRREDVAAELQHQHGYTLIPPFNHRDVVAGQGTAVAELHQQIDSLDTIVVPCGGGGLLSGSALASRAMAPECRVIGVEPELGDDAVRSFRTGSIQTVSNPQTIADGTRTESLGSITFPIIMDKVDDMVTVTEQAIIDAVAFLLLRTKLLVEPSGALGIAALLSGAVSGSGRTGVLISGGNIDPETVKTVLTTASEH